TYAAIVPAGQIAGHTASATARLIDTPTRLQLAGKRMKIAVAVTGTSVPIATPSRPSGFASKMLSETLTIAVATLTPATRQWRPAPLSSVLPGALPTRTTTITASSLTTTTVPSNSGPTHDRTSGPAISRRTAAIGTTVASEKRVPTRNSRCRRSRRSEA